MRDGYSAVYRPFYPEYCFQDMIIQTIDQSGAYLRGNYELILHRNGKFGSEYFEDIDDLKDFIAEEFGKSVDAVIANVKSRVVDGDLNVSERDFDY